MCSSNKEHKYELNLPETDFPMRGNLPKAEPVMLEKWYQDNLYQLVRESRKGKPLFWLQDGPPYANGNIHLGHALNKILKDIILKSKTLEGFDAPFQPGWDCHGLPIELKVEALVGKPGVNVSAKEFRDACRAYAAEQVDGQRQDFKRLGILADWDNPYLTMDFKTEANIIRSLAELVRRGHMFKGFKPVYWCPECASALSDAEVEYRNKKSDSIYVAFKAVDGKEVASKFGVQVEDPVFALIWTTTPWTIPSNRAISLGPDFEYVLVRATVNNNEHFSKQSYFVLAKELVEQVAKENNFADYVVLGNAVKGKDLDLLKFEHPLFDFQVPFINGDHVGLDAGTGLVHTAPDHGLEDFDVCRKYGIELALIMNDDSCFKADVPKFAGLSVNNANGPVISELAHCGRLVSKSKIEHSYPHCWRHKTPIIYRATPQWFIGMDVAGLRQDVLRQIRENVDWIPEWGEQRIDNMVTTRPDWCISRQRTWGVPIPIFTHKETGELHPQTNELFEKVAQLVEKDGIQAWSDLNAEDLLGADAVNYTKATDTLDVWFDSGSVTQSVSNGLQADLYLEGSDQHRGWFMSSICVGVGCKDEAPYKAVLTHGFIVDGKGQKMSKSLGNTIVPQEVNDELGADILRLWVAQTDYTSDARVSKEILKYSTELYRRVRNTSRFLLANLKGFDPKTDLVPFEQMLPVDRYVLSLANKLQKEVRKDYQEYDFHLLVKKLIHFCSVELGSFYLDLVKDRIYVMKLKSLARRSAQTAMYHLLHVLTRLMSPILSFTAQEVWEKIPGEHSKYVFTEYYYDQLPEENNSELDDKYFTELRSYRDEVLPLIEALRVNKEVGSSLDAKLSIYASEERQAFFNKLEDELKFFFLVSEVEVLPLEDNSEGKDVVFKVSKHLAPKCELTWHHDASVGTNAEHPTLSARAVSNLFGEGETRKYC